jgi:hypothetical protein
MTRMDAFTLPPLSCAPSAPRRGTLGLRRVAVDDALGTLTATFELKDATGVDQPLPPFVLDPRSYSLTGGHRCFPHIVEVNPDALSDRRVILTLDTGGDFSIYTLTISGTGLDPFFTSRRLRFRLDCDDPFDCREPVPAAEPPQEVPVAIDYLAKDYAGFRQALLDFVSTRFPSWTERSEADVGMMLLELFATQADWLSYLQDRVANEAFLGTATRRSSVAGHLALLGYRLFEGTTAATWLRFEVQPGASGTNQIVSLPPRTQVTTPPRLTDPSLVDPRHAVEPIIVFETLDDATLASSLNDLRLYDWDRADCCLAADAYEAALIGEHLALKPGDYLLFASSRGPRAVVRLIEPPSILSADALAPGIPSGPLTIIRWGKSTPLIHAFCVAETAVSANLVVATHGTTVREELRALTDQEREIVTAEIAARKPWQRVPRQRLALARGPLAHLDPATRGLVAPVDAPQEPPDDPARPALPVSTLEVSVDDTQWTQRPTLLDAGPADEVYRVEIEDDGQATIVFGDDCYGATPEELATVSAAYQVGGGIVGNVGADTLTTLPSLPSGEVRELGILSVTNPLPAAGGRDAETRDRARRTGPATFKTPLVAVTALDYENAARDFADRPGHQPIQRAHAEFRWTGSWLTVTLAVDPKDTPTPDPGLDEALLTYLEGRRLAGYDLEAISARYVPLEVAVEICVRSGFRSDDVVNGVKLALSGLFDPDNFSFGEGVVVGKLYAAIMAVPGVESAEITRLARVSAHRPTEETRRGLREGVLRVGIDEIIRLDNDRTVPENGTFSVAPKGTVT